MVVEILVLQGLLRFESKTTALITRRESFEWINSDFSVNLNTAKMDALFAAECLVHG